MNNRTARTIRKAALALGIGTDAPKKYYIERHGLGSRGLPPPHTIWCLGERRFYQLCKRAWKHHHRLAYDYEYAIPLMDLGVIRDPIREFKEKAARKLTQRSLRGLDRRGRKFMLRRFPELRGPKPEPKDDTISRRTLAMCDASAAAMKKGQVGPPIDLNRHLENES